MSLQAWKDVAEIVQGFGVGVAALLGIIWSRFLWGRHREGYPWAKITHRIGTIPIGDHTVVRLTVEIQNVGKVLMQIDKGHARVQQLLPCTDEQLRKLRDGENEAKNKPELDWFQLGEKERLDWKVEVEPGESEELYFDFVLPPGVERIALYSHFENRSKHGRDELGWSKTTTHELTHDG